MNASRVTREENHIGLKSSKESILFHVNASNRYKTPKRDGEI